ncbi:GNAT family acetyltransferase [Xanthobacter dioxanivorans]|uniref:GNAT family acetyltransferase n=1 Tax=Xanthobacter dioxanivorans TaxID=2528964 RepID=A0A974PNF4_9HYPH|nr:GNAT family acetyltransferase [Xanthobacter dioxanivorans]QRG06409.1 GNAT family acetyltransferase [Xanthobacter dioxanivorans]
MSDILIHAETPTLAFGHAEDADTPAIVGLWERAGLTRPWNDPHADIALARRGPHSTILLAKAGAKDGAVLAGSVMVGHDGHRGWIYYLAVEPALQGRGIGRALLIAAEDWLRARAVPKLMLLVRPDNEQVRGFYQAAGYLEEPRVVFSRRLDGK